MKTTNQDHSIFTYVLDHIDEDGLFSASTLPDEPEQLLPRSLGSDDAYIYTTEMPNDIESAEAIHKILSQYLAEPSIVGKELLYATLAKTMCIGTCEPLIDQLSREEIPLELLHLAKEWLYTAQHREVIKFSIIFCSLFSLSDIKKDPEDNLWNDLLTLARCEEFTFFVLFAYRVSSVNPQKEIWELLRCTKGWGRVFAINEAEFPTKAKQRWLLTEGPLLIIDYPPVALEIIRSGHMAQVLQQEKIPTALYHGCLITLNNYLKLLLNFDLNQDNSFLDIRAIDSAKLFDDFLNHAERHIKIPADILGLIHLSVGLTDLINTEKWQALDANTCHRLIGRCEKLIYSRDWKSYIDKKLFLKDGSVDQTVVELAFELDFDIWPQLFNYFQKHPSAFNLFVYLLAYDEQERSGRVLALIEKNLPLYVQSQIALLVPLKYLELYPGQGIPIIVAALTSMYDWPRGAATLILASWGNEYITPPIRTALIAARRLNNHPIIEIRIDSLLENRPFTIDTILEQLQNKI